MYIHLWRKLRVSWAILLHLVEPRNHPVETWSALIFRGMEVRGSSHKLRRTEVWRSFTKLRGTELRCTVKLWTVEPRSLWSVPKLETRTRTVKSLTVELMSVGKVHRVARLIVHHESLCFMHKPSVPFHVIHHHHHSGVWGSEARMGPREPLSRWAHRADRSRTAEPTVRRRWCWHTMRWSRSRNRSIYITFQTLAVFAHFPTVGG